MSVISILVPVNIPADPTLALTTALCGIYGYQAMLPTVSGLIPNPQSSGDFAAIQLSGFCIRAINTYYTQIASFTAQSMTTSGVNYLVSSGVTGGVFF